MANQERIFKFIDITHTDVQQLFQRIDPQLLVKSVKPLTTGMSTSNYHVTTNRQSFLLKIYPEDNNHSKKEMAAYEYAHRTIQAPKVFAYGTCPHSKNAFAILQYIKGDTLRSSIEKRAEFPLKSANRVGRVLASLHNRQYKSHGLLDNQLEICKSLAPFEEQYELLLNGFAGKHIGKAFSEQLRNFLDSKQHLLTEIAEQNVFLHGDFIPTNILCDSSDDLWFIDFEYCKAGPRYVDIGKFFRRRTHFTEYVNDEVYASFAEGYNATSATLLPPHWLMLAKIADIATMLGLINKEKIPEGWVNEIRSDIKKTISHLS